MDAFFRNLSAACAPNGPMNIINKPITCGLTVSEERSLDSDLRLRVIDPNDLVVPGSRFCLVGDSIGATQDSKKTSMALLITHAHTDWIGVAGSKRPSFTRFCVPTRSPCTASPDFSRSLARTWPKTTSPRSTLSNVWICMASSTSSVPELLLTSSLRSGLTGMTRSRPSTWVAVALSWRT